MSTSDEAPSDPISTSANTASESSEHRSAPAAAPVASGGDWGSRQNASSPFSGATHRQPDAVVETAVVDPSFDDEGELDIPDFLK
jgi:cell division protein FtsZ